MTEKFRPNLHFSPQSGWMNDPNGMIRLGDTWHLFFQHDPDSTVHGPMHWGHAISSNLVQWQELPIALYPSDLGTCYSGSAIETGEGDIKLFYTAHRRTEEGQPYQIQCLVHADRNVTHFAVDPANPIVPNPGIPAFRDPKVIWHDATRRWIMLVTEGQTIGFYGSENLVDWTYLSKFGEGHGRHSHKPWECPDLVPLTAPDGSTHWVLIVGVNPGGYAPGSGTQYFIGAFDGTTFTNANAPGTELWLDYGRDYYAAQTFFERGGTDAPVAIAWASNWFYANQTQTESFRGVMSLPRELRLIATAGGLRVAAGAPEIVVSSYDANETAGTKRTELAADLAVGDRMEIFLFGEKAAQFVVARTSEVAGTIRTVRADMAGMNQFGHDYEVPLSWPKTGPLDLTLFVDRGLVELCAAGGATWITNVYFPAQPEAPVVTKVMEVANG